MSVLIRNRLWWWWYNILVFGQGDRKAILGFVWGCVWLQGFWVGKHKMFLRSVSQNMVKDGYCLKESPKYLPVGHQITLSCTIKFCNHALSEFKHHLWTDGIRRQITWNWKDVDSISFVSYSIWRNDYLKTVHTCNTISFDSNSIKRQMKCNLFTLISIKIKRYCYFETGDLIAQIKVIWGINWLIL